MSYILNKTLMNIISDFEEQQKELTDTKTKAKTNETNYSALLQRISNVEAVNSTQSSQISSLQSQTSSLQSQISSLSGQIASINSEITNIKKDINKIKNKIPGL